MSLDSVVQMYFGMLDRRDTRAANEERTRIQDERLDIERERLGEMQRQFNVKTTEAQKAQAGVDAYRTALTDNTTALTKIRNRKEQVEANEDRSNRVLNILTHHQGHAGDKLLEYNKDIYAIDGTKSTKAMQLNEGVFKKLLERRDASLLEMLGGTFDQLPLDAAVKDAKYGHSESAAQGELFIPAGQNEKGEDVFYVRGTYPEESGGGESVLTDEATTAGEDLGTALTTSQIFDAFEFDFKTNILGGSQFGRTYRNSLTTKFNQVNLQLHQIDSARDELTSEVATGVKGLAEYKNDPKLARELYSIFADRNTPQEVKDRILFDQADYMGVSVPSILKNRQQDELVPLAGDDEVMVGRGEAPEGIVGERGVIDTATGLKTPYTKGSSRSLFAALAAPSISKDLQAEKMSSTDKKVLDARDKVTRLDKEMSNLWVDLQNAKDDTETRTIEEAITTRAQDRTNTIDSTNVDIFKQVKSDIARFTNSRDSAGDEQKPHWQRRIDRREEELQELLNEGLVTTTMATTEYKKLSDKVMGVDGSTLIRDGDPEGIQEILRSLDQKLSGGLSFSDTEVAIARKAAEEAGLTAEYARLKSAPLEQLIIAKALMIAGTEAEAEKRYIAAETDNMIYTNNPTLSTQQLATMEIQAGQVQASQINAEANLLQQQRLTKQALDTALASQNTIEADRLGITMGYLDDISKLVNTEDSSGNTFAQRSQKYANADFFGDHTSEFALDWNLISDEVNKFIERDADGIPTRIVDQKAFDLLSDYQDRLAMYLIQHKAKKGIASNFATLYGATSGRNLRANSNDPSKMTEFYFVDENGDKKGSGIRRKNLDQLVQARDYLISRVMVNNLLDNEAAQP